MWCVWCGVYVHVCVSEWFIWYVGCMYGVVWCIQCICVCGIMYMVCVCGVYDMCDTCGIVCICGVGW